VHIGVVGQADMRHGLAWLLMLPIFNLTSRVVYFEEVGERGKHEDEREGKRVEVSVECL
jgi:hypothetical protein